MGAATVLRGTPRCLAALGVRPSCAAFGACYMFPVSMMRHAALALAATVMLCGATACSRPNASSETTRQQEVATCAKAGDRCEFAPGKIGLCTAKEGSEGSPLTCVSLH